jgi:flavin reductase (DIM6/NTAB) family NADH-FMN oxidoreductase RutF
MAKISLGAKTLAVPAPAWLVGSYDGAGRPNLVTVAWGGICSSDPPCVTVSLRKSRHSYASIVARKAFTVNVPSENFVREVDYAGIVSGKNSDKFAETGLTPIASDLVDAPYVGEFPLIVECRLLQTVELGIHTQFIGEIVDVKAETDVLDEACLPDGAKVRPIIFDTATRNYYGLGQLIGRGFSIGNELRKGGRGRGNE